MLDGVYNYCPLCGQENTDNNVSVKTLVADFFNNYLSIDSRFVKSLRPFLLKPGQLTSEFMSGKRVSFMHPIRLYLILSLFYFFIFSQAGKKIAADDDSSGANFELQTDDGGVVVVGAEGSKADTLDGIPKAVMDPKTWSNMDFSDSAATMSTLKRLDSLGVADLDLDSIAAEIASDTTSNTNPADEDAGHGVFSDGNVEIVTALKDNKDFSNKEIYDSLYTDGFSDFEAMIARQYIRVARADQDAVLGHVLKNLPVMMFFMLPIFALILQVLYIRRKKLYVQHLVHGIHLHSFAYLVYGIALLLQVFVFNSGTVDVIIFLVSFALVTFYSYKSFRNFYQQRRFKTMVKFLLVGLIYYFTIFVAVLVEAFLSLFTY